jgi:DNA-binding response OmpR family regulator
MSHQDQPLLSATPLSKIYDNSVKKQISPFTHENEKYYCRQDTKYTEHYETTQTNFNESRKKILIIEDSDTLRGTILEILSQKYNVIGLCDASQAIQTCSYTKPDIILLDVMLPGSIDGFSFLRIIKNDRDLAYIPVLLMSLLSTNDVIIEGLKLGANDYIVKPFDIVQLDLKIKNQLNVNNQLLEKMRREEHISFKIKNENQNILKKFELLLEETIMAGEDMPIEKYAERLNMSQSTFERMVKKNFKTSPSKYILQRKLKKANILIRGNNGISIKEVSLTLGFSSSSYFSRCYKSFYGRSPSSVNY